MKEIDIGYRFKDNKWLLQAFTHSSYGNEFNEPSNETLEFLGDSVLGMLVSDWLFNNQKGTSEGVLSQSRSRINSNIVLSKVGEKFFKHLRLGSSFADKEQSETMHAKADLVEAIVGAIWQDSKDLNECMKFLSTHLDFEKLIETDCDYKTQLQHLAQKDGGKPPEYKTVQDGDKFSSRVFIDGKMFGQGSGTKKQQAEMTAAKQALKRF